MGGSEARRLKRDGRRMVPPQQQRAPVRIAPSLLAAMKDDREYESIVSLVPKDEAVLTRDINVALADLAAIRGRPCICYIANVVKPVDRTGIDTEDDLPFAELVSSIPAEAREVDIFLVTPGGSGQQVNQFVHALRPRFNKVGFLLPFRALSAGTLWALAGDEIIMDPRAYIGPIDPQIRSKGGAQVPAQAMFALIDEIQRRGEESLKNGGQPDWTLIRMLDSIDPKELGSALSSSKYVEALASSYIDQYKFKFWTTRASSGIPVTEEYRKERAAAISALLCNHNFWRSHSHGITREVAEQQLRLQIGHPEETPALLRAMRRLWALFYYAFEKSNIRKAFIGDGYTVVMNAPDPFATGRPDA